MAVENVLISFTAETAGLQPGIDGLVQLEVVDKELADQVKKTSAEISKRDKTLSDGAKASGKSVEALATSFTKLDKSIVGGAYNKTMKDLEKNLKGTNDEFKRLSLVLDAAKQKLAQLKPNSKEWQEMNAQIQAGQVILQKFGEEEAKTEVRTKSLRTELRAMKEEIARRTAGGEAGPELDDLIQKAGDLDDALKDVNQRISATGSDTRNIEGLVQVLGTATQTIIGVQAAQSLLGEENEEFNRVLAKLNALMAISNAVQAVQTSLLKESAAVTAIEALQRKASLAITSLQTAAESKNIVVRYAAIAAQKLLNAAMAANPIGIVIVALSALASLVLVFTSNVTDAAKAQAAFNDALDTGGKRLDAELSGIESANAKIVADMKKRGATDQELTKQELDNIRQKNEARKRAIAEMERTRAETDVLDADGVAKYKELGDQILKVESEVNAGVNESITVRAEATRQSYLSGLKSATAYAEARIALAKRGSKAELDAEIAAVRARAAEQRLSNPNLSAGERKLIEANVIREIANLRFNFQKKALEDAKKAIDAEVLKSKEGSREELDFKIQQLQIARDIELKDQELTFNKRKEIETRYWKEREDLVKAFNQKAAEDVVNQRIAETNSQLSLLQVANVADTNAQVVELKKQLIDEQAALEVLSIQATETNEKLRLAKIKAIYDQSLAAKQELERAKNAAEIEGDFNYSDKKYQVEILRNQAILLNDKSTAEQRKAAQTDLNNFSQRQTDNYFDYLSRKYAAGVITSEEYYDALAAKDLDYWQTRVQLVEQSTQMEQQMRQQAYDMAAQLIDGLFQLDQEGYQRDQEENQDRYDKKLITEREYENRRNQIEKQKAAAQKQKALFDIGIDLAQSIFRVQAQAAVLAANPLTAALSAQALAQIPLLIASAAISTGLVLAKKYRHGGFIEGPGTGTSDSVPIWASKGEHITRYEQAAKHREALKAINEDKFHDYLINYEMPKLISMFSMPEIPVAKEKYVETRTTDKIDYEKLAKLVGKAVGDQPKVNVHIDEEGIVKLIQTGLSTMEYKNKKLLL